MKTQTKKQKIDYWQTENANNLTAFLAGVAVVAAAAAFLAGVAAVVAAAFAVAAAAFLAGVAAAFAAVVAESTENNKKSISYSTLSLLLSLISFGITFGANIDLNFLSHWSTYLILFILMESIFLIRRNKAINDLWDVAGYKLSSLFYASIALFGGFFAYQLGNKYSDTILKWIGYIGAGLIGLALIGIIIYGYLKLNKYLAEKFK